MCKGLSLFLLLISFTVQAEQWPGEEWPTGPKITRCKGAGELRLPTPRRHHPPRHPHRRLADHPRRPDHLRTLRRPDHRANPAPDLVDQQKPDGHRPRRGVRRRPVQTRRSSREVLPAAGKTPGDTNRRSAALGLWHRLAGRLRIRPAEILGGGDALHPWSSRHGRVHRRSRQPTPNRGRHSVIPVATAICSRPR